MADAVPAPFHELIRARRQTLGLTQAELAIVVNVNPTTISRLERGQIKQHCPRIDTLCHLAAALDVSIETLAAAACAALT